MVVFNASLRNSMKVTGSHSARISAAPERCYAALLDFAAYPAWFPGVKEAEPLGNDQGAPTVRLLFSAGISAVPDVSCVLRYDVQENRRLTPTVIEGNLRVGGAGWRLESIGEGLTEATYDAQIEMRVPGGFVAERAFSGPARKYLIEQPPERLRRHVESGAGSS